jgi:protein-tyrosine phosphatase
MLKRLYLSDVGGEATRDGRRLKTGLLYRSSAIHKLRADERAYLRELGIRHIIDLREPSVVARRPDALVAEAVTHLPVGMGVLETVKPGDVLRRRVDVRQLAYRHLYADVLDANGDSVRGFLDSLLDKPIPALVHCTAGKDRTGILVSVLYLALGVPREQIVQSYMAIMPHLEDYFPATLRWLVRVFDGPPLAYSVIPEYIERMLDRIEEKYGGAERYFQSIGFARVDTLKARFLD